MGDWSCSDNFAIRCRTLSTCECNSAPSRILCVGASAPLCCVGQSDAGSFACDSAKSHVSAADCVAHCSSHAWKSSWALSRSVGTPSPCLWQCTAYTNTCREGKREREKGGGGREGFVAGHDVFVFVFSKRYKMKKGGLLRDFVCVEIFCHKVVVKQKKYEQAGLYYSHPPTHTHPTTHTRTWAYMVASWYRAKTWPPARACSSHRPAS